MSQNESEASDKDVRMKVANGRIRKKPTSDVIRARKIRERMQKRKAMLLDE